MTHTKMLEASKPFNEGGRFPSRNLHISIHFHQFNDEETPRVYIESLLDLDRGLVRREVAPGESFDAAIIEVCNELIRRRAEENPKPALEEAA